MEVLVSPVSGGHFPNQIAACEALMKVGYIPGLVVAASGGAVTAFIMDWDPERLDGVVSEINSTLFVKSPYVPYLGVLWSALHGSFYAFSTTAVSFTKEMLGRSNRANLTEIWISVNDTEYYMPQLLCNRQSAEAKFGLLPLEEKLFNLKLCKYADNNLDTIGMFIQGCSAIPGLLPKAEVFGRKYADAGLSYASPMVCFRENMTRVAQDWNVPFHFTMLSEVDLNGKCPRRYVSRGMQLFRT